MLDTDTKRRIDTARDILKNASPPTASPRPSRAFPKVIDEFSHDPSERLGDAGFLISAHKHIMRRHDPSHPSNRADRSVKPLTPDETGRLAKNFKGYDISPDMGRLSLVNLHLHGFTDPHIYEYDTLTSEERWG